MLKSQWIRGMQPWAVCALVAGVLAGCGGEQAPRDEPTRPSSADARRHALAVPTELDALAFLDWVEFRLPELFPKGPPAVALSVEGRDYTVRAYAGAWGTRYLAVAAQGDVLGLGDFTGSQLRTFGKSSDFRGQVLADTCGVVPRACGLMGPSLSTDGRYALALRRDGSVVAWGVGDEPSLPGGGVAGPNPRDLGLKARVVMATLSAALVVGTDGVTRGWGNGSTPYMGTSPQPLPKQVLSPRLPEYPLDVQNFAMTWHSTTGSTLSTALALRADGTVWLMPGREELISREEVKRTATQIAGLSGVASLGTGGGGMTVPYMAVKADGTVWKIETGALETPRLEPSVRVRPVTVMQQAGLPGMRQVSCEYTCLGVASDGTVWYWSIGFDARQPRQVPGVLGMSRVFAVNTASPSGVSRYALAADGRLWDLAPVIDAMDIGGRADPVRVGPFADIVEVAIGAGSTLVRRRDGTVWGWGNPVLTQGRKGTAEAPAQVVGVNLN